MRPGQEHPVVAVHGTLHCLCGAPLLDGRHDVEGDEGVDHGVMVERHAVGNPATAVMTGDGEAAVPEVGHHRHQVVGEGALRVGQVIG
jgi:hypothetical protein